MILFPAMDLKDGQCVRLREGRMESARIFETNPLRQARRLKEAGFSCLHLVDLNAATGEGRSNGDILREIRAKIDLPMQLGGGLRRREDIEGWLKGGMDRVILGTALFEAPNMVRSLMEDYAGRIVLALDSRDGHIVTRGWLEEQGETAAAALMRLAEWRPAAFLYTEVSRDGLMTGLDIGATEALAGASPAPLIASGGLSGMEDLAALAASPLAKAGAIEGVIAGRALYDGRLPAEEALALASDRLRGFAL